MHASYTLDCRIPGTFALVNFLCDEHYRLSSFISIPISDNTHFLHNHRRMEALDYFNNPGQHYHFLSLLYDSLAALQDDMNKQSVHPLISASLQYMNEHLYEEQLCNDNIAAHLGISTIYFRKLFLQNLQQSPMQYLQQLRMQKACYLLSHTTDSVASVSAACGYSSIYHFCRIFKLKNHLTPTQYRNRNRLSCL